MHKSQSNKKPCTFFPVSFFYYFFVHIKMLAGYYKKYKERLQKKSRERYPDHSEVQKNKTCFWLGCTFSK